jgi:hypothetical protein
MREAATNGTMVKWFGGKDRAMMFVARVCYFGSRTNFYFVVGIF